MLWLRLVSLTIVAVLVLCAISAPLLSPHDPYRGSLELRGMDPFEAWAYPLGTDNLGRDVLSRLIHGARNAVAVIMTTLVLSSTIGTILGTAAGFSGSIGCMIDRLLVGPTAGVAGLPTWSRVLLSACLGSFFGLFFTALYGGGFIKVVMVLALLSTPRVVLAVRNAVKGIAGLGVAEIDNEAWAGNSRSRMMINIAITVMVTGSIQFKSVFLLESLLTFLGVGMLPPAPAWGLMVAGALWEISGWWYAFWFPLASIIATAAALLFLGWWVQEVLGSRIVLAGHPVGGPVPSRRKDRHVAGLLAIFLGCFGVHKFYLGNVKMGIIYLICSTLGNLLIVPPLVVLVVSIVEGIRYLMTDDEGFQRRYVDPPLNQMSRVKHEDFR